MERRVKTSKMFSKDYKMKRCPNCHRFGVEYDSQIHKEKCIWNDCLWVNEKNIDVTKIYHPIQFTNLHSLLNKSERIVEFKE